MSHEDRGAVLGAKSLDLKFPRHTLVSLLVFVVFGSATTWKSLKNA